MGKLKLVENILKVAAAVISAAMSIIKLIGSAGKWKSAYAQLLLYSISKEAEVPRIAGQGINEKQKIKAKDTDRSFIYGGYCPILTCLCMR